MLSAYAPRARSVAKKSTSPRALASAAVSGESSRTRRKSIASALRRAAPAARAVRRVASPRPGGVSNHTTADARTERIGRHFGSTQSSRMRQDIRRLQIIGHDIMFAGSDEHDHGEHFQQGETADAA